MHGSNWIKLFIQKFIVSHSKLSITEITSNPAPAASWQLAIREWNEKAIWWIEHFILSLSLFLSWYAEIVHFSLEFF